MRAHGGFDAGVVAQAGEVGQRAVRGREVGEGEEGVEGVCCFVLGFAVVVGAGGRGGFDGGGGSLSGRRGGLGEGGEI